MATAVEVSRDNEELVYSASDDYSSSSDAEEERVGLRSAVVVQKNSPPAKRPRHDLSPSGGDRPQWVEKPTVAAPKKELDPILTRTGGAYIPPARLRMMQEQISDKSSVAYQRMSWEALKKSINGLINKVNIANIGHIVQEILQENIVRGRGLLARSIITAQVSSPTFTHVYAALVAIINTKFPQIGELIAKRLIQQFRRAFRRNDKNTCLSSVRFIAHLVNQQVTHELLALELLTVLLEDPSSDSVEVAVGFLKECGHKLTELSPRGVHGVFESMKGILHDGNVDVRVQYMIEVMFAIRKDGFKEHPSIVEGLDVVEEEDQITHLLSLEDEIEGEERLNVFQADPNFLENEEKYRQIKAEMLGGDSDDESGEASSGDEEDEDDDDEEEEDEGEGVTIEDMTETNLLALRRTVYLTIMSSLDFEECAHKILKMNIKPGQEVEVAYMIIECCSQERSYQRFYGLLGERFCHLNQLWVEKFDAAFLQQYGTVHRLETNKLRNVAKFFAQLFYTDALPWTCMACIRLNEDETTSSSRIFIKIMFQELAEYMGLPKLNERLKDPFLSTAFEGLMPRDNPRNTRFAINFFTSIGLGGLTDDLREHLKNAPKLIMSQHQTVESDSSSSDSDDESSSDSDSSEDSSSDASSSSSSDEEERRRRRRKEQARRDQERDSRRERRKERPRDNGKAHRRTDRSEEREDRRKSRRDDKTQESRHHRDRSREKRRGDRTNDSRRHRSRSPPSSHRKRSRSPRTSHRRRRS